LLEGIIFGREMHPLSPNGLLHAKMYVLTRQVTVIGWWLTIEHCSDRRSCGGWSGVPGLFGTRMLEVWCEYEVAVHWGFGIIRSYSDQI